VRKKKKRSEIAQRRKGPGSGSEPSDKGPQDCDQTLDRTWQDKSFTEAGRGGLRERLISPNSKTIGTGMNQEKSEKVRPMGLNLVGEDPTSGGLATSVSGEVTRKGRIEKWKSPPGLKPLEYTCRKRHDGPFKC